MPRELPRGLRRTLLIIGGLVLLWVLGRGIFWTLIKATLFFALVAGALYLWWMMRGSGDDGAA